MSSGRGPGRDVADAQAMAATLAPFWNTVAKLEKQPRGAN